MGVLLNKIKSDLSSTNLTMYYKDNTSLLYNLYQNPKDGVDAIPISDMSEGRFYMIMYQDDSNWMKFSPIFLVDYKKFEDKIILYGINLNFIPLEIRAGFFDKYLRNLEDENQFTNITFESAYRELLKIGYEYALMEYNVKRILRSYNIRMNILPNFLYSSWPTNKYDPQKLYSIWAKKIETKEERHKAIIKTMVDEYYKETEEIKEDVSILKDKIDRIQKGEEKYNGK